MRRVLILGGTGWLGHRIAAAAVAEGAEVACLARGESGDVPVGARLIAADRREPGAYEGVGGEWDEVVEVSYSPDLVEPALKALGPRTAHWTLVSTISVYATADEPNADESATLVEPTDPSAYADAKVLAERASTLHVGDRLLIARAGLIVGPGDPSDRFGYWPARLSRGGAVLAPNPAGRYVQVIDVDDLATWIERAGRQGVVGPIHAVGESHTMSEYFKAAREVSDFEGELVTLEDDALLAEGVQYWAGPRSLPLWPPADATGFAQRSNAAFRAAGGSLRPLAETVARSLADERERGVDRQRRAGLEASEEAETLADVAR